VPMVRDNMTVAGSIAVLVDNREIVRFCRLAEGSSGAINLTTMLPEQDRAYVEVYFVNGRLRQPVHTFRARSIRRGANRPRIVLSGHVRGDATVSLRVDGELVASESFAVPDAMRRHLVLPWLAGAAALALIAALGLGGWWLASGGGGSGVGAEGVLRGGDAARGRTGGVLPGEDATAGAAQASPDEDATGGDGEDLPGEDASAGAAPALPAVPGLVYFEPESSLLLDATRRTLDEIAAGIATWVGEGGDPSALAIEATGHTALYDSEESRLELSRERARAVADYLRAALRDDGLAEVTFVTEGEGGRDPVTRSVADQWRNRRVEISVDRAE
jgi:outer membrane protein OmpA-like peptidoglycan-associated protein